MIAGVHVERKKNFTGKLVSKTLDVIAYERINSSKSDLEKQTKSV